MSAPEQTPEAGHTPQTAPPDRAGRSRPARRRTRLIVASALVGVLACGGGIAVATFSTMAASAEQPLPRPQGATALVEQGDLQGTSRVAGTLAYADPYELQSGLGGVVTWLPEAGSQIGQGQPLYAVDNQDVYLMLGSLPAWRAFESGMPDGPDVEQLEQALKTLGFFTRAPDQHFDWYTLQAIKAWQKASGQQQTGSVPLGRLVFRPTEVRVAQLKVAVGDQVGAGTPLVSITSLSKQVQVQVRLADQQLATQGGKVQVQLPDGKTVPATIQSVGVPTLQSPSDPNSATIIPVIVAPDDPTAVDGYQQASVVVIFPTETRKDVLSVPLSALIALPGGGFGVQLTEKNGAIREVPVKTGLFAGDRVEVSGGLKAGERVVVPST